MTPAGILVPPRSIPIARPPSTSAGTLLRRMASEEKPYRVYRGGRKKGKVPAVPRSRAVPMRSEKLRASGVGRRLRIPARRSWKLIALVVLLGLILLTIAWGVAGYLSFEQGVAAAQR